MASAAQPVPGRPPVYRQIAARLRARIDGGELAAGEQLPPIRRLAHELGVHRDTVALAYELLAQEGRVESAVGRGTFVRTAPRAPAAPRPLALTGTVEALLAHEAARPRPAAAPGLIAMHALIPDPALYPAEAFRRTLGRVLAEGGASLLLYGGPQGHPGLRQVLAERFAAAGIALGPDEIVLCHGASQGISLALRLFASAGDAIAVELPTYANVLSTLLALGLRAEPVPMAAPQVADAGVDLEALDRTLARPDVKAFYTIPTFHNPLGTSTGRRHREALLAIAARHGKPVLEDAFEMDLRYEGRGAPPLAALDEAGIVVLLTSFSKSLFPGVRVGAIGARGRAAQALVALKHATDFADAMPLQAALAAFVESGAYDRHLARLRRELRHRRDALLEALEAWMPAGTTWTRPEGGYQLWLELPATPHEIDTRELLADAARAGVLFAPGAEFRVGRGASRGMRLSVAQADAEALRRGARLLGRVVRERMDSDPAARQAARVQV